MNILLTGATGQLGGELLPLLSLRGHVITLLALVAVWLRQRQVTGGR